MFVCVCVCELSVTHLIFRRPSTSKAPGGSVLALGLFPHQLVYPVLWFVAASLTQLHFCNNCFALTLRVGSEDPFSYQCRGNTLHYWHHPVELQGFRWFLWFIIQSSSTPRFDPTSCNECRIPMLLMTGEWLWKNELHGSISTQWLLLYSNFAIFWYPQVLSVPWNNPGTSWTPSYFNSILHPFTTDPYSSSPSIYNTTHPNSSHKFALCICSPSRWLMSLRYLHSASFHFYFPQNVKKKIVEMIQHIWMETSKHIQAARHFLSIGSSSSYHYHTSRLDHIILLMQLDIFLDTGSLFFYQLSHTMSVKNDILNVSKIILIQNTLTLLEYT